MALMEKIQTVGNAVNEMKNKLGLPVSSPLQEVVDKCGTGGGEAYDGILPVQPSIQIAQSNKNTLHITLTEYDKYTDGVRVYYKENAIPEHNDNSNYIDIELPELEAYIELDTNKNFGFRYNSYVITENGNKVFQTAEMGNSQEKATVFYNNTAIEVDFPEEIAKDSSNNFLYSKNFERFFLIETGSPYTIYELVDYSWKVFGYANSNPNRWVDTKYGLFASQSISNGTSNGARCVIDLVNNKVHNYSTNVAASNVFVAGDGEVFYMSKSSNKYTNPGYKYNGETQSLDELSAVYGVTFSQSDYINSLACNGRVYTFTTKDAYYYEDGEWHNIVRAGSSLTSMNQNAELFRLEYNSCIALPDNRVLIRTSNDSKLYLVSDTGITALGITANQMYLSKNNTLYYIRSGGLYYLSNDYTTENTIKTDSNMTNNDIFNTSYTYGSNTHMREDKFGYMTMNYYSQGRTVLTIDTNTNEIVATTSDSGGTHIELTYEGYALIYKGNAREMHYFDPVTKSYVLIGYIGTYGVNSSYFYSSRKMVKIGDFIFMSNGDNYNLDLIYKKDKVIPIIGYRKVSLAGVADMGDGKFAIYTNSNDDGYKYLEYDAETGKITRDSSKTYQMGYAGGEFLVTRPAVYSQVVDRTERKIYDIGDNQTLDIHNNFSNVWAKTWEEVPHFVTFRDNDTYNSVIILKGSRQISLNGSSYQEMYAGEEYIERGCDASSVLPNGVDYTDQVVIDTSELDVYKIGVQRVYYRLNIDDEEIIGTRKVNVKDPYKWEINPPTVTTVVGHDFTLPEYKLYQISGDELIDITASVTYTHNVDITTEGEYEITFTSNAIYGIVSEYKIPVKVASSEILMADYSGEPTQYAGGIVSSVSTGGALTTTEEKYTSSPKSLRLNGSSYIRYNFTYLQQFTIELFFYKADSASYPRLLYLGGINREIEVKGSSNAMYINGEISAGWVQNAWNKFTITRDSNNLITYYCNDKQLKTETNSSQLTYLQLGKGSDSGNYFNGYVDDLVVTNDKPFKSYKYWLAHKWVGNSSSTGNNAYYVGYSDTLPVGTNYSITPINIYLKFSTLEKMETFLDTYDTSLAETITATNNKMSLNTSPEYSLYSNFDIYNDGKLYFAKNVEDAE